MLMSFFPWVLYVIAWVLTLVAVHYGAPLLAPLLYYMVILCCGVQGIWAAIGHLAFPAKTAQRIGWQSNGFQVEIGFANLGLGITGLLTFLFPFWAPSIALFTVIFYGGCAFNHIKDRVVNKNDAPCNSGPMLYSTIATVVTLLVCLVGLFFKLNN